MQFPDFALIVEIQELQQESSSYRIQGNLEISEIFSTFCKHLY